MLDEDESEDLLEPFISAYNTHSESMCQVAQFLAASSAESRRKYCLYLCPWPVSGAYTSDYSSPAPSVLGDLLSLFPAVTPLVGACLEVPLPGVSWAASFVFSDVSINNCMNIS